jgi:hypothetical protein
VVAMVRKVVPREDIPRMLSGKYPHPVQFQNHKSLYTNWPFSNDQIQKLVQYGAVGIWTEKEPPLIVNPMGVVVSGGKERLICNDRYINLFLEALPFQYKRLRDILAFTKKGFFMATWDLKPGYFHVPIHQDFWKYFGFKVGNITFYFKVLCFGYAQACFIFTKVMQEPAFELRKRGIPISDYIDDSFTAARTRNRCLRQSVLSALFFGALGAFMGLPKCNFWPQLLLKWLGFMVDSQEEMFKVGESKILKVKRALEDALNRPDNSSRRLAALAGQIVVVSPAVMPAALYSRSLFEAMQGRVAWDEIFPTPETVQETAKFWLENIDRFNGRRWWPRPVKVEVKVDASRIGFRGTIRIDSQESVPFAGTFTEDQMAGSSTEREVRGYAAALSIIAQQFGSKIDGASILLYGDNQGAVSVLNKLRSPHKGIHRILHEVFRLCYEFGFDLVAKWSPREELAEEDEMSRRPDPLDWALSAETFQQVVNHFGVGPSVDLFASDRHHVADTFVSRYYTPGCSAIDATKLDWRSLVDRGEIAWLFPPLKCASLAISLLEEFKVEALVCLSLRRESNELLQFRSMAGAVLSDPFVIPRCEASCIPSCRVPHEVINPAFIGSKVVQITWN